MLYTNLRWNGGRRFNPDSVKEITIRSIRLNVRKIHACINVLRIPFAGR